MPHWQTPWKEANLYSLTVSSRPGMTRFARANTHRTFTLRWEPLRPALQDSSATIGSHGCAENSGNWLIYRHRTLTGRAVHRR